MAKSEMRVVEHTREIEAPARVLYEVVTDYERYPDWLPEFRSARILRKEGNETDVEFVFAVPIKQIRYSIRVQHDPEKLETRWHFLSGEIIDDTEGGWRFEPLGENRTRIYYRVGVSINVPVSKGIVNRVASLLTETTIPRMFSELHKQAKKRLARAGS
jgi:ribosome-associated toxin RatA of RatAB toxin-antitoxin module